MKTLFSLIYSLFTALEEVGSRRMKVGNEVG